MSLRPCQELSDRSKEYVSVRMAVHKHAPKKPNSSRNHFPWSGRKGRKSLVGIIYLTVVSVFVWISGPKFCIQFTVLIFGKFRLGHLPVLQKSSQDTGDCCSENFWYVGVDLIRASLAPSESESDRILIAHRQIFVWNIIGNELQMRRAGELELLSLANRVFDYDKMSPSDIFSSCSAQPAGLLIGPLASLNPAVLKYDPD